MWSTSRRKSAHPPAPVMQLLICEMIFSIFQARTSEVLFHLEGIAVNLLYLASAPCHNIIHRDIDYLNILLDIMLAHDINEIMQPRTEYQELTDILESLYIRHHLWTPSEPLASPVSCSKLPELWLTSPGYKQTGALHLSHTMCVFPFP